MGALLAPRVGSFRNRSSQGWVPGVGDMFVRVVPWGGGVAPYMLALAVEREGYLQLPQKEHFWTNPNWKIYSY